MYVLDFNKDGWMDIALTHAGSAWHLAVAQCAGQAL